MAPSTPTTGVTDPLIQEFYDLQKEYSEASAAASATANDVQSLERARGEHDYAKRTAEGEGKGAKNTYEGMTRQVDALKRQVAEGWSQLKLFADQIDRKEDLKSFYEHWAVKSCRDHFMNWLAISIGETKNNERKIMARIYKIMMRDGSALRGASTPTMNVEPLELGGLATVTPFPTEMYQRALQTDQELQSDYIKYNGETERLAKKEGDVAQDEAEASEYQAKATTGLSDADREGMLSDDAQSQLAAIRSRLDGERQHLRSIEARMNAIKREKGYDPTAQASS
jgi:hypothetical protein